MKGFMLGAQGDVIVEKNDIKLAYDGDLIRQTIKQVLSTNRGEWQFNPQEGIPVQKVLTKNPNLAKIKDYVRSAVRQVDSTLEMTACDIKITGRTLMINFTVTGQAGAVNIEMEV